MTIEQAIRKAIKEGFQWPTIKCKDPYIHYFLNPSFWQALGKAMGWEKEMSECVECGKTNLDESCKHLSLYKQYNGEWLYHWHRFIDHLASGGDADSFFKMLV